MSYASDKDLPPPFYFANVRKEERRGLRSVSPQRFDRPRTRGSSSPRRSVRSSPCRCTVPSGADRSGAGGLCRCRTVADCAQVVPTPIRNEILIFL